MQRGTCRTCGAPLIWIRTAASGTFIPLNAEPDEKGNIIIMDDRAVVRRGDLFEEMMPAGPRYMPHHATCPQGKQHRKKK